MSIKKQLKKCLKKILTFFARFGLENRDFSILSNNCWGGCVYDQYGLMYRTPTIGLWIPSKDYIKFLTDIDHYLKCEVEQISYLDCHAKELLLERKKSGKYKKDLEELVIGRIDDIDIIFLHYNSFQDAVNKWKRRKKRLNFENLLVKFNDQNGFQMKDYTDFVKLPYKNKLFFTSIMDLKDETNVVYYADTTPLNEGGGVLDDTDLKKLPFRLKKMLNQLKSE